MAQTVDKNNESVAPNDYRALVCIFLQGGNDANNMLIPNHASTSLSNYQTYFNVRNPSGLALPQSSLLPISVPRMSGLSYGFHPNLGTVTNGANAGIYPLWAAGKLAVVANVGNLVFPMTRAQYQSNTLKKPYQLFSHSDQVDQNQSGRADTRAYLGWGGKLADKRSLSDNPNAVVPMITSIQGTQLFTLGQTTTPLAIASGNTALNNVLVLQGYGTDSVSTARRSALNTLRGQDLESNVIKAASHITDQANLASQALSVPTDVTTVFPNTNLGNQLKQVARMIKKRGELSVNRQIFYVQAGSFDTHNGQLDGQGNLLTQISQAMRAFYDEMTTQSIQDSVTSFTLSDFSRTFVPAGQGASIVGTDHAWGTHALVMGGAVRGGDFYGMNTGNGTPFPTLAIGTTDDTDSGSGARGRWIPTTSVDQYAATLSRWYGLPEADIPSVFPNIGNFTTSNLGFMNP